MKSIIIENYSNAAESALSSFYANYNASGMPTTEDTKGHVISIARSLMMHRDNIMHGGGFVTAIINNDLEGAIGRADDVCKNHLPFFVHCKRYVYMD